MLRRVKEASHPQPSATRPCQSPDGRRQVRTKGTAAHLLRKQSQSCTIKGKVKKRKKHGLRKLSQKKKLVGKPSIIRKEAEQTLETCKMPGLNFREGEGRPREALVLDRRQIATSAAMEEMALQVERNGCVGSGFRSQPPR
ncbi:hypothetical protein U1Q18_032165 [Sarracenia purpurea var. burkii]